MENLTSVNKITIILSTLSIALVFLTFFFQNLINFSKRKTMIFRIAVIVMFFLFSSAAYFGGVRVKFYNVNLEPIKETRTEEKSDVAFKAALLEKPLPEECTNEPHCSDFTDTENWKGWERFYKSPDNPREFQAVPSGVFDAPRLWYQKTDTSPEFSLKLKITPKNDVKGNIIISYGDVWRCIIAESNYNAITCEETTPTKRRYLKYLTTEGYKPIKPKTQITLENLLTSITSTGDLSLSFKLAYVSIEEENVKADINFIIKLPSAKPKEMREYIGVGLIDPNNEAIKAEFQFFNLKPL